jgi:hypothetical protein
MTMAKKIDRMALTAGIGGTIKCASMVDRVEIIIFPDLKRLAREEKSRQIRAAVEAREKKVREQRERNQRRQPDLKITCYDADGNEVKS